MTSLISLELIPMVPFPYVIPTSYPREPAPQLLQPRRQAGVDDRVAGLDDEAAEDRPVHTRCEPDLLAQLARQGPGQPLLLLVREVDGRRGGHPDAARGLVGEERVLLGDLTELVDAARLHEEPGEVDGLAIRLVTEDGRDGVLSAPDCDRGV